MILGTPGFMATTPQCFGLTAVFLTFGSIPGNMLYHNPHPGPNDFLDSQNNFTSNDLVENDGFQNMIVYSYPISAADRLAGRYCTLTGMWAAGRDIVHVDGKPYIREYARTSETERYRRSKI